MIHALQLACAISIAIVAFALAVASSGESLWLDELHTAWAALGPWQEIAPRATAGNQTPVYYWIVATIVWATQSLVSMEYALRSASIVAWLASLITVALSVRIGCQSADAGRLSADPSRKVRGGVLGLAWVAVSLLVFDRIQWFYASEARPYALVQLASLLGWLCLLICRNAAARNARRTYYWAALGWLLSAAFAIQLHLTAVIPIAWQCALGCLLLPARWNILAADRAPQPGTWYCAPRSWWLLMSTSLAIFCLPLASIAFPVWDRRNQWSSFASETSLSNTLWQFPLLALWLPVLVAGVLQWIMGLAGIDARTSERTTQHNSMERLRPHFDWHLAVWYLAALGPFMSAWLLTYFGIAPLMHRRFLMACAIPLVLAGILTVARFRSPVIRCLCCTAMSISLLASQGTLDLWRSGQMVGLMRYEDWRSMTPTLVDMRQTDEPIFLVSGLIEANQLPEPLPESLKDYLNFPLNTIYSRSEQMRENVVPLENDAQRWNARIAPVLAKLDPATQRAWIVYRGSRQRLETKLRILESSLQASGWECIFPTLSNFANLHLAQLRRVTR